MRDFWLTEEQLLELRKAHRAGRNRHEAYKINAVILLGTGCKIKDVKEALFIDDDTLRTFVKKYQLGGIKELVQVNYQGRCCLLTEDQQKQLCEALESTIFVTTQEVISFVERTFGVVYKASGMRDLLHRLGYENKKPKLVPGNPDREQQEDFVEYYTSLMEKKPVNEEVIFVDAVYPEHNTMTAYGWIKRGQKRKLKTNAGRQRLNFHGAINIETLEMTVVESSAVNADSTVELLEIINQKYPGSDRLHIILDNTKYHCSKQVEKFLKDAPRINLVFLPSYSPELNLIERVWGFFKKRVLHNKYYADLNEFRSASINFFRNIDAYKSDLRSLLFGGFEGFC